jgi:dipeptidase E
MRFYLASFRLGWHHERLRRLAGRGRRTALIPNALQSAPPKDRVWGLRRDVDELEAAGLEVTLLDLQEPGTVDRLAAFDIVWVRGSNVFLLRRALADTDADTALINLLQRDAVVYGGYSARACVLIPDAGAYP